jgi:hypothetical protein
MSVIYVHPEHARADAATLSTALAMATAGDVVLLGPGVYGPSRTQEVLPLRVPAGVAIEGAGPDNCIVDGEGLFEPSFGPIRPDLAVVLGDGSSLSGVEVTNGGGPASACLRASRRRSVTAPSPGTAIMGSTCAASSKR